MQPIFSDEIIEHSQNKKLKEKTMLDFNDILESVGTLSEDEKLQLGEKLGFSVKASEVEKKLSDAEEAKKLAETKANKEASEVKKLSDEVKKLSDDLAKKEKDNKFTVMLTEGKVVEAQREAYMNGDMVKFAENAVSVNLSEQGSGSDEGTESDVAEKKLNELAETKVKDEGVNFAEAYKSVVKANPELYKKLSA
jgi:hypothetical protein